MNNYVNPYLNPYVMQQQPFQGTQMSFTPQQQVVKVHGEEGARAYQMGANSSALLLDECGTIVWLATTDGASYKSITPYDITPHQISKPEDYSTLETRISRLEELINERTDSANITPIKSRKSTNADAPKD